jgi:hypothetical protein
MPPARVNHPIPLKVAAMAATLLSMLWTAGTDTAFAQRPFFANDPLYRDETARRTYHHGYALSGELTYRPVNSGASGSTSNVGILFRLDYALAKQFDVSAIVDAFGGLASQNLRLSWLSVRHQWHSDGADMAVRLAFEPRPPIGGGIGFRQTDAAFFYSKPLSPSVETEIALGVRNVRNGFRSFGESLDLTETKGWEVHLVLGYNMIFDPARSHVSLAFGYEAGRYDVSDRVRPPSSSEADRSSEFSGHVLWIKTGLNWNRPSYQLVPFFSVPIVAGKSGDGFEQGKGPRYVNLGVRITLR